MGSGCDLCLEAGSEEGTEAVGQIKFLANAPDLILLFAVTCNEAPKCLLIKRTWLHAVTSKILCTQPILILDQDVALKEPAAVGQDDCI